MSLPVEIKDGQGTDQLASVDVFGRLGVTGAVEIFDLPDQSKGAFGDLVAVPFTPVAALSFNYNINSYFIATGTLGGGTVTQSSSLAVLQTSTGSSGSAQIESRKAVRYTPGQGITVRFTAIFTKFADNSQQEIGIGDTSNGFFFMFSGSQFGICRRQSGIDTFIPQSLWNGEDILDGQGPSQASIDPTQGNVYQIRYQWLGFGAIKFFVEHPFTGEFALVHTLLYANQNTLPSVIFPSLPLHARVVNLGNTTNVKLQTPSMGAYIDGVPSVDGAPGATGSSVNTTNEVPVVALLNTGTFQGVPNRVRVKLMKMGVASGGGAVGVFRAILNPVLTSASFFPFDPSTSVVQIDEVATAVSGGREIYRTRVGANSSVSEPISDLELRLNPGDVVAFTARSLAGATTFFVDAVWREEFEG